MGQQPFGTISWMPCLALAQARDRAVAEAIAGDRLFEQRQFAAALSHYRRAIELTPENAIFHFKAAFAAWRCDLGDVVEGDLLEAIRINPEYGPAHDMLGQWYRYTSRLPLALHHSRIAIELDPQNPDFIVSRAIVLAGDGQDQAAWDLIEPLLDNNAVAERVAIVYARIASGIGRENQALEWINHHLRESGPAPQERPELHYAIAALLDRMGKFDEAFEHARAAHELFHRGHDPIAHGAKIERQIAFCTAERMRSLPHATHGSRRPVFILGMPRSGTSLIEQILASHPRVFGAGELQTLGNIASDCEREAGPYPACLERLTTEKANRLAAGYLSAIDALNPSAAYVTDKMPMNFLHLDLIELLFPDCHVIHSVRDPLDTCLSCYMTDFTAGSHWAWNLRHLGNYYRQYQRLMTHWKQALTVKILEVRYEDVVGDLEGQTRRMLEFLELPWDDRCLSFHQSTRPVATASKDQVRRPLYASSVGRWRHYEKHLSELIDELSPQRDDRTRALREAAEGNVLFDQGHYPESLVRYQQAVRLWPTDAEFHLKLASAAWRAEQSHLVEPHLLEAIRLDSRHARAHDLLARWHHHKDHVDKALAHSAKAIELEPHNTEFILTRALVLEAAGDTQEAWKLIEPVLEDSFLAERAAGLYARIAPRIQQESRALERIGRSLQSPPIDPSIRPRTHFAAASLLDRMGRYDEAIAQARAARQLMGLSHDPAEHAAYISAKIAYATAERMRRLPHATHGNRRPVFIVGMPRSGTSLVEQILACHPQVYGAGELDDLVRVSASLHDQGDPYPLCLDKLTTPKANRIAGEYLAAIASLNSTATYVTDKNPFNYVHLELIELFFPDSHVIHCVRDPLDTCLSCYMTDFEVANGFQSELRHVGTYYRQYERLMAHWKSVLKLPMLEVRYEDVVNDVEGQARRMLEFLSLPWDERCLSFHQSRRPVTTASRDQVRRPLYASSVGRWRHYEKHLSELIGALNGDG